MKQLCWNSTFCNNGNTLRIKVTLFPTYVVCILLTYSHTYFKTTFRVDMDWLIWVFFRIMRLGLDRPSNDMRVFGAFSYCSLDIVDTYFNIWIEFAQGVSQISFILKIHAAMQFLFLAKVFPIHVSQKLWLSQQGWNLISDWMP